MSDPTITTFIDQQLAGERRIKLFVTLELVAVIIVSTMLLSFGLPHEIYSGLIICVVVGIIAGITYLFRKSPYSEIGIYINLAVTVLLIVAAGPLSGNLDGSSWVLLNIPPLIATIVINRSRATIIIVSFAIVMLSIGVFLQLNQIVVVELVLPSQSLIVSMANTILVLIVIGVTVHILVSRANQALKIAYESRLQAEEQLARERQLVQQQQHANQELEQSIAAIQERDAQIKTEAQEQARLRMLLSEVSTPVIPILEGVVIMPLVGMLEGSRAQELTTTLLQGIERYNAKLAIIDVTGLTTIDTFIGKSLITAADGCALLGAKPILAGLSPEVAQTLVMLNIDFHSLVTVADLQSGVEYALAQQLRYPQRRTA